MPAQRIYRALEGGGVRGIAHIGAAAVLDALPDHYDTIANVGTSAGSDAAALLSAGISAEAAKKATLEFPFARVIGGIDSLPVVGPAVEGEHLIHDGGLHDGRRLEAAVAETLGTHAGVRTFGDIEARVAAGVPNASKLFITAHDVSRGAVVFPDAYADIYGIKNPNSQSLAFAARASSSIPGFFTPAPIVDAHGLTTYLADGGIDAILPYDTARQLVAERDPGARVINFALGEPAAPANLNAHSPFFGIEYFMQMVRSISSGRRDQLMGDPAVRKDTVMIDTGGVSSTEFNLTANQQLFLYNSGVASALEFVVRDLGQSLTSADRMRLDALAISAQRDITSLVADAVRNRGAVKATEVASLNRRLGAVTTALTRPEAALN